MLQQCFTCQNKNQESSCQHCSPDSTTEPALPFHAIVATIPECSLAESDLSTNFQKIVLKEQLDNLEIDKVINDIMNFVRSINVFMEQNEPWKLVKSDKVQAGNILYHCAESLRLAAIMLSPVMPSKTKDILDILGTSDVELVWGKLKAESKISISKPVFPRIS